MSFANMMAFTAAVQVFFIGITFISCSANEVNIEEQKASAKNFNDQLNIGTVDNSSGKVNQLPNALNLNESLLPVNLTLEQIHAKERGLSDVISRNVRVSCWIMTQPNNHYSKALAVRATWGRRCTSLFFVSSQPVTLPSGTLDDQRLPPLITVIYNGSESRPVLWTKTKIGLRYAYDHFFDSADWFLRADDDTYTVMENLRMLLLHKDPSMPVYYGCKYKVFMPTHGWMDGGAGMVLSKEALRRFIEEALPNPKVSCNRGPYGYDDYELGNCLKSVGVVAGDSQDPEGKGRFFHTQVQSILDPTYKLQPWFVPFMWHPHPMGENCCSDSMIGFHYVSPDIMRLMDFLIYHVHPFGIDPILTGSHLRDTIESYLKHKKPCNVTKMTSLNSTLYKT